MRIADAVKAPHYPMPLPVIASTIHEKALFLAQKSVISVVDLARQADVTFVGVGQMGDSAPLVQDGFVNAAEMRALVKAGAVGEIVGWAFDANGNLIEGLTNDRVASVALDQPATRLVVAVAMGVFKAKALKAALAGRLITGLITNETTAELLL
jgi:DNA-binding transcriptional regulator LsrR (DeoR family)